MLCHCIGGVIPGCGVIFDNSSDGYSCKHAAVCWKYYALYNKLVHSPVGEMEVEEAKEEMEEQLVNSQSLAPLE